MVVCWHRHFCHASLKFHLKSHFVIWQHTTAPIGKCNHDDFAYIPQKLSPTSPVSPPHPHTPFLPPPPPPPPTRVSNADVALLHGTRVGNSLSSARASLHNLQSHTGLHTAVLQHCSTQTQSDGLHPSLSLPSISFPNRLKLYAYDPSPLLLALLALQRLLLM